MKKQNVIVAIILSFFCPGLGQIYNNKIIKGFILFLLNYFLLFIYYTFLPFCYVGYIANYFFPFIFPAVILYDVIFLTIKNDRLEKKYLNNRKIYVLMILINLLFTVMSVKLLLDIGRYKTLINPSEGMSPTILLKERFVVDTWYYKFNKVRTGDILFFRDKDIEEGRTLIKRCVAIGGDNIEIRNLRLSVNGVEKKEDYINNKLYLEGLDEKDKEIMLNLKSITIPNGFFFCLGDNRTNSIDSRFFGPISYDDIMGKAIYIYYSDDFKRIGKNL